MKLLEILFFIHVANVSAQLISEQQASPGFIQTHRTISGVTSARTSNFTTHGTDISRRNATGLYNKERNESKGQKNASVQGRQRTDQTPEVFTHVSQDRYGNKVKYIQRLKSNSEPDKVIFHDEVNYDMEPFTNKRKPEDNFTYSSGPRRDPSVTPGNRISFASEKQHQKSSKDSSNALGNEYYNKPSEGTLYSTKDEETTTVEVELDNRVAFNGDACATGLVKVKGKCVKEVQ